jgi:putative hemolysin
MMFFRILFAPALLILLPGMAGAGGDTCLTGGCHQALNEKKYIHGPVAAEQAGAAGCTACHVPAGRECSPDAAGVFEPPAPAETMCQNCHTVGNETQHTTEERDCLRCHDPHGSDSSPVFVREE